MISYFSPFSHAEFLLTSMFGKKKCIWALFLVTVLWRTFQCLTGHQWLLEDGLRNSMDLPSIWGICSTWWCSLAKTDNMGQGSSSQGKLEAGRRGLSNLERRYEYLFLVKVRKTYSTVNPLAWCRKKWVRYLVAQLFKEWKRCSCSPEVYFK